jgi:hypothetical protein
LWGQRALRDCKSVGETLRWFEASPLHQPPQHRLEFGSVLGRICRRAGRLFVPPVAAALPGAGGRARTLPVDERFCSGGTPPLPATPFNRRVRPAQRVVFSGPRPQVCQSGSGRIGQSTVCVNMRPESFIALYPMRAKSSLRLLPRSTPHARATKRCQGTADWLRCRTDRRRCPEWFSTWRPSAAVDGAAMVPSWVPL